MKETTKVFFEKSGTKLNSENNFKLMVEQLRDMASQVEALQPGASAKFERTIELAIERLPELQEVIALEFEQAFTEEDLIALGDILSSPLGEKLMGFQDSRRRVMMEHGRDWMQRITEEVDKEFDSKED